MHIKQAKLQDAIFFTNLIGYKKAAPEQLYGLQKTNILLYKPFDCTGFLYTTP
jgi:hypothetical protein